MGLIGGASGALVVDLQTGQTLFSDAADVARPPASVEKLYTTSTALIRLGPSATLSTQVRAVGSVDSSGAWNGTLYLVGGGDPTFGSSSFDRTWYGAGATMQRLVSNLVKATGIKSVHGAIVGDESYFDSRRGTPSTGYHAYIPDVEGELTALAYNRGFADLYGNVGQPRPALYAAEQFAIALRAAGVRVPAKTSIYTGQAPSQTTTLAAVHSPRLSKLLQLTNAPSDNYFAEMLLKGLGAAFGGAGTTAAGAAVVRAQIAQSLRIHPVLVDGSGLSYSDSTSPTDVVALLTHMQSNQTFLNSLAIGGQTGTLKDYTKGTAAQGNCHGKTGTLSDVANLSGYCRARDGHMLAFAFLANSVSDTYYVHQVEADVMAADLASYDG
jgi:D-alanyl-D-alanine carboxypeptidase/D-alanyl-D-alanine-endopeptidase (penicillin-binding protein 4)